MSLLFKTYSLAEVISLLFRLDKTKFFLWNKKDDRNGVNEQNIHTSHAEKNTHISHAEKNTHTSQLVVNDIPYFKSNWPILPIHPFLWESSKPAFFGIFPQTKTPIYKGRVPTMLVYEFFHGHSSNEEWNRKKGALFQKVLSSLHWH